MDKFITIPFNVPFLETVVRRWISETQQSDQSGQQNLKGMIIVPNQRTVKALINSFLKVTRGSPILLPRIISVGNIDESFPVFNDGDALTLWPAVHPMKRLAILTGLIMKMNARTGDRTLAGEAWNLAGSLAELMDEAEWAGCDLRTSLSKAVEGEYARHWQDVLKFLGIITNIWPQWLQDNQCMNPVERMIALLQRRIALWDKEPVAFPVWAVGFSDARPILVEFLSAVIRLPKGRMILSAFQGDLSEESWNRLAMTHPYSEMARMFRAMKIKRSDFRKWEDIDHQWIPEERVNLFHQVLLPAELLDQWLTERQPLMLENCHLIEPLNQRQEASAIALIIRDALEDPDKKIALVTPDRNLAMSVALELGRWGIMADDSAGEPLHKTPSAILLGLVLQVCVEQFTPVSLLALLKHPLVCCGYEPATCRNYARLLEVHVLRQFAALGLDTIQSALQEKIREMMDVDPAALTMDRADFLSMARELENLLHLLQDFISPLLGKKKQHSLAEWVTLLVQVVERLVSNGTQDGESILWRAEEGNALAEHLRDLINETEFIQDITLAEFASILNASYQGMKVHSRRALRGRMERELHPRVYIWGLLEARLQTVDMVILGGLAEGIWPPVLNSGPWLSRPMREKIGMPLPDVEVGRAAHHFMTLCCSVPEVVLSSPLRLDNAPVVQSRWIVRLKAWLNRKGMGKLTTHPALEWVRLLDRPHSVPQPIARPCPRPPLMWRPKSISITDVKKWISDPYEIYAKYVLNLKKIDGLDEDRFHILFGVIVHEGLEHAYREHGENFSFEQLGLYLLQAMERRQDLLPSYKKWWKDRLVNIACWVREQEEKRQQEKGHARFYLEQKGYYNFLREEKIDFTLRGRADRLDLYPNGFVEIYDYKTGKTPSTKTVQQGLEPQLPLEAAMACRGAFGKELIGGQEKITHFYYWTLKGTGKDDKETFIANQIESASTVSENTIISELCWAGLKRLIHAYYDESQPYLSRPRPWMLKDSSQKQSRFGDYTHLARVLEWGWGTEG